MAKQPRYLTGQVAAITGAARGIGRATAEAFIREGMKVAIGDLDLETAKKTAAELGPAAIALPVNVTERASMREFLDATEEQLGPIDVLVNNAGIMQIGPFLEEDDATAQRQIDININGVLFGMKEILPRMISRNRGHLVNIASAAGKGGFPGGATYCGTKHFVVGASEAVRAELRETNIEVSVVMPAIVNTELAAGTTQSRGVKKVEPEDVAAEIVDALKVPRFDVYVPRVVGKIGAAMNILPRSGREAIARALKADQVLMQIDHNERRAYELRASNSEPGLEPGDQPAQLTQTTNGS
ncbi:SDR family oxidoreductase [Svornostia abyssi]|uniref:SDR family oxidoreductase n=1 Tax=Svornostia abyssi TaxID=2898438 RepID=A0ABY5PKG1_9ACTN|nr:SDR family oxidoreductase [Parviterribacteraceae bacterium J379]